MTTTDKKWLHTDSQKVIRHLMICVQVKEQEINGLKLDVETAKLEVKLAENRGKLEVEQMRQLWATELKNQGKEIERLSALLKLGTPLPGIAPGSIKVWEPEPSWFRRIFGRKKK